MEIITSSKSRTKRIKGNELGIGQFYQVKKAIHARQGLNFDDCIVYVINHAIHLIAENNDRVMYCDPTSDYILCNPVKLNWDKIKIDISEATSE